MAGFEKVINLRPVADRVLLLKKCNLPCEARCGDCDRCREACPDDCMNGVETGYGHVWKLRDTIPAFLVPELLNIFQNRQEFMTTAAGLTYFGETVTKLVRRSYPKVDHEKLHEVLDLEDWAVILLHFLSQVMRAGIAAPAASPMEETPV